MSAKTCHQCDGVGRQPFTTEQCARCRGRGVIADPAPYCDHGPFDACRCLAPQAIAVGQSAPEPEPGVDAEDMHVYAHEFDPIGGYVCAECGTPTESEPCPEHQPIAYSKMT